jgi:hypothetical protein
MRWFETQTAANCKAGCSRSRWPVLGTTNPRCDKKTAGLVEKIMTVATDRHPPEIETTADRDPITATTDLLVPTTVIPRVDPGPIPDAT